MSIPEIRRRHLASSESKERQNNPLLPLSPPLSNCSSIEQIQPSSAPVSKSFLTRLRSWLLPTAAEKQAVIKDQLDWLLQNRGYLLAAGDPESEINTSFFQIFCEFEDLEIWIPYKGSLTVTSKEIDYVLRNMPGIDLRAKNREGKTILWNIRSVDTLQLVIERAPNLINVQVGDRKETIMLLCVQFDLSIDETLRERKYKILKYLISKDADLRLRYEKGETLLHVVRRLETAKLLVEKDPDIIFLKDDDGHKPAEQPFGNELVKKFLLDFEKKQSPKATIK